MDFFSNYEEYHLKVVDTLKGALYRKDNEIFNKLDFYDEEIFSEPLLFSCINSNYDTWIDTIVFGLTKKTQDSIHIESLVLQNDMIYIPKVGYFKLANYHQSKVKVKYDKEKIEILDLDNNPISYEFTPLIRNKDGLEFLICNHPLLENLFVNLDGKVIEVSVTDELYAKNIDYFNSALEIIKNVYPEYYNLVIKYIKKVVFYKGDSNSFATIQAHGIAFFSVKDNYDEIFFLDNILHQCAHVFFNALTFDKSELFTIPHTSLFSVFTGDESDKKEVLYERFHGLFTQAIINICLEDCIQNELYHGEQHFKLIGRFALNMSRFSDAVEKFDIPENYKAEGLKWFSFFQNTQQRITQKNSAILEKYNITDQPYVFDYKTFKEANDL
jgi:hypothetical protein